MAPTSSQSSVPRSSARVRAISKARGEARKPKHERAPAPGGTTMRVIPSRSATVHACMGAAPPYA